MVLRLVCVWLVTLHAAILVSSQADFWCLLSCYNSAYCNTVPSDGCNDNQILVKNGSACSCCDACYNVQGEGQFCRVNKENSQFMICKDGLKCDTKFSICLNDTSFQEMYPNNLKEYVSKIFSFISNFKG